MEMPAQGGHDKLDLKRSGHAVSHKRHGVSVPCWRERGEEGTCPLQKSRTEHTVSHKRHVLTCRVGESEAPTELFYRIKAKRTR
jgi:hypothetical protein